MKRLSLALVLASTLLAPAWGRAATVLRANCIYSGPAAPPPSSPLYAVPMLGTEPIGSSFKIQYSESGSKLACGEPASGQQKLPQELTEEVYSVKEVNSLMTSLKSDLQKVLEKAVFKAAVQEDQITLVEDELWRRMRVKYGQEIETLETTIAELHKKAAALAKTTEDLQNKIQAIPAAPSTAPGVTRP